MNATTKPAPQSTALAPLVAFKRELDIIAPELPTSNAVPIEKMKSAIVVAVQKSPALLNADRSTLWQSARMCAADGLVPDGREAAFVFFKTKKKDDDGNEAWVDAVQYIPMVYGLRKRALMSGEVKDIRAYLVYEGEWNAGRFEMIAGDEEKIIHRPIVDGAPGEPERGPVIGAYAIAVLKDGAIVRQWMPLADVEKRRRAAPSQRIYEKGKPPKVSDKPLGVWADWWEEQVLKTAVRAICKKLPLSSDDMRALMESDHDFEPSAPRREQVKATSLEERLRAAQAPAEPAPPAPEEEVKEEVEDAVVLPDFDETVVFPGDAAFTEGAKAFKKGIPDDACPHTANPAYSNWLAGWQGAQEAAVDA